MQAFTTTAAVCLGKSVPVRGGCFGGQKKILVVVVVISDGVITIEGVVLQGVAGLAILW